MADVTLSEMLTQLRRELLAAEREGAGSDLRLRIENIDLELNVVTRREAEGGGGVKVWVLDASGKGKATDETAQKLRLSLKPYVADADDEGGERKPLDVKHQGVLEG